ncbi:MAG: monovalent cation/H(+) antiporter subunit G [Clostridium sp.]|nr:monovalent cation/H(+) antiporter subunit G [Clostridium sp.]
MIRFCAGVFFLLAGLLILGIATYGLFRFRYVLNRIHVAAKCDSLGTILVCIGLMLFSGNLSEILKLMLVILFIWLLNPVASHLIARVEVETNPEVEKECEVERWN